MVVAARAVATSAKAGVGGVEEEQRGDSGNSGAKEDGENYAHHRRTVSHPARRIENEARALTSTTHRAYLLRVAAHLESQSRRATWRVGVDCEAGTVWLEVTGGQPDVERGMDLLRQVAATIKERLEPGPDR
jgi:hypothetical protein